MKRPGIHAIKTNGRLYIRADSVVGVLKFIKSYWSAKEGRDFRTAISIAIDEFKAIEAQSYEEEEEE